MSALSLSQVTNDIIAAAPGLPAEMAAVITRALTGDVDGGLQEFFIITAIMIAVAALFEYGGGRKLAQLRSMIRSQTTDSVAISLGYALLRIILSVLEILLFSVGAHLVLMIALPESDPRTDTLEMLVAGWVTFRILQMILRAVLSPYAEDIRPIGISTPLARAVYSGVMWFIGTYIVIETITLLTPEQGASPELSKVTAVLVGMPLIALMIGLAWSGRNAVARLFGATDDMSAFQQVIARAWPILFTGWILIIFSLWSRSILTEDPELLAACQMMWWMTILFPFADRGLFATLKKLSQVPKLQEKSYAERTARFRRVMQTGLRLIMLGVAMIGLVDAFAVTESTLTENQWVSLLMDATIDIGLTVMVAYIIWELTSAALDQAIPDDEGTQDDDAGEGGGAGATRKETLAPLLKTTILIVLSISVVLTALHALGVQIGPLIAGAGVVGIAVGFGAQKLVQDILSGVFFLIDDAFRKGEYIEAGGLKGTVENISIRSMQLRHHLGAVQTLPYSEIQSVKNLSRDWVIMKLEIRLPFDTDVDKVRKIIKKVGIGMMDDPVMGPDILAPLKSQGVTRIEESALIIRMKFTTLPGKQWVVRREAYTRVKSALETNGIQFAHREIRVHGGGDDPSGAAGSIDPAALEGSAAPAGGDR